MRMDVAAWAEVPRAAGRRIAWATNKPAVGVAVAVDPREGSPPLRRLKVLVGVRHQNKHCGCYC